jgi:hypothetical protein
VATFNYGTTLIITRCTFHYDHRNPEPFVILTQQYSTLFTLPYLAEIERRDDPETVFVVPGHMNLTLRQMDIILLAGQQPGVPFRLGASGAQRPQVRSRGIIFRMGQLGYCFPIYIAHVMVTNLLMCSETHHMIG